MIVRFKKLVTGDKFTRLVADIPCPEERDVNASTIYCKVGEAKAVNEDAQLIDFFPDQQVFRIKRAEKVMS